MSKIVESLVELSGIVGVSSREGAVAAWNQMGIQWMYRVAGELGVRMDTPYRDLTTEEKDIVMNGPEVQRMVMIPSSNGKLFELNCTYRNARRAVEESLGKALTEKAVERVDRFLTIRPCQDCGGTRLNDAARAVLLCGLTLPEACAMPLSELSVWVSGVPDRLVVMPGGKIYFAELKTDKGTPTILQCRQMDRLFSLGCDVTLLQGRDQVKKFLERLGNERKEGDAV